MSSYEEILCGHETNDTSKHYIRNLQRQLAEARATIAQWVECGDTIMREVIGTSKPLSDSDVIGEVRRLQRGLEDAQDDAMQWELTSSHLLKRAETAEQQLAEARTDLARREQKERALRPEADALCLLLAKAREERDAARAGAAALRAALERLVEWSKIGDGCELCMVDRGHMNHASDCPIPQAEQALAQPAGAEWLALARRAADCLQNAYETIGNGTYDSIEQAMRLMEPVLRDCDKAGLLDQEGPK